MVTSTEPVLREKAVDRRRARPRLLALLPILALIAFVGYMWFVSRVLPSEEKYPSGRLRAAGYVKREGITTYRRHGHWVTYHENGVKASEGFYERGEPVGEWRYWDSDGTAIHSSTQPSAFESSRFEAPCSRGDSACSARSLHAECVIKSACET